VPQDDGESAGGAATVVERPAFSTLAKYTGVRRSQPNAKVTIDTQKFTFTARGTMTIHALFEPASASEGADVSQADLFQVNFSITPDDYVRLFEGDGEVQLARHAGALSGSQSAEATTKQGARLVTLRWDNAGEENTRKGELVIELDDRRFIRRARLTKSAKRFIGGFVPIFDETVEAPVRGDTGLSLRDAGELGRVQTEGQIRSAVTDSSPSNFRTLVQQVRTGST
jgi:hypothetical protein